MNVKIREGRDSDYPYLEEIERLCFPDSGRTREQLEQRVFSNPGPYFIVAEVDGRVVGYEMGYEVKGKLYNCYKAVHPDFQRKGIGKLLLDQQLEIARERGYKYVFIKTSNQAPGMLILALKNGFKIIGYKDREWDDEPAIWLEKEVE